MNVSGSATWNANKTLTGCSDGTVNLQASFGS
jgi:hypothetical protein